VKVLVFELVICVIRPDICIAHFFLSHKLVSSAALKNNFIVGSAVIAAILAGNF
jgi:hypothetical protein